MSAAKKLQPGEPRDRPILFRAEMVRAILSGRKSQTRRLADFPPDTSSVRWVLNEETVPNGRYTGWVVECGAPFLLPRKCPYGAPGDRLWVKETWGYRGSSWTNARPNEHVYAIEYQADDAKRRFPFNHEPNGLPKQRPAGVILPHGATEEEILDATWAYDEYLTRYWRQWRPSIFMPRWASRIMLTLTSVRVERLAEITEEDAKAEGVTLGEYASHYGAFANLWESINGAESWDSNPWVWVLGWDKAEVRS